MKDSWDSGDPYEYYMGRWSSLVAGHFISWLSPTPGANWLDVGCGSGALSACIIANCIPTGMIAIDQSEGFVKTAHKRLGNNADCRVGNALSLAVDADSVNYTVSGLVLNFIPEPVNALGEMRRVTKVGGTVAVYVWDYAGKMDLLRYFWDTVIELDPKASSLHEGNRFPNANSEQLEALFACAGFADVMTMPLDIVMNFQDFDDYWKPFLGGQGPAPTYVQSLEETNRRMLRDALNEKLPVREDGSIPLAARAWAAKGRKT
jgi:SAM-dependent methyltransferase